MEKSVTTTFVRCMKPGRMIDASNDKGGETLVCRWDARAETGQQLSRLRRCGLSCPLWIMDPGSQSDPNVKAEKGLTTKVRTDCISTLYRGRIRPRAGMRTKYTRVANGLAMKTEEGGFDGVWCS